MVLKIFVVVVGLVAAAQISLASSVPAFLWSPGFSNIEVKESVNYQIISPKDLANSVLSQGRWSDLLCSGRKHEHAVDLAIVFVGRELHSSDVAGNKHVDPALVNLLKVSFTRSNFSMAFPYVAASEEETMENLLFSGFMEACGHGLGVSNVAFSESCSIEGGDFQKLANLHSEHLVSRMEKRRKGETDLVVLCHGGSHSLKELGLKRPESEIMSEVISSVELSGTKYAALYVSDPFESIHYPAYRELERFLAEGTAGNEGNDSAHSTDCDEGIVLLLILISGLCCMMGIDTPTRFEAPQDN
ncbi:hypothetical protein QQP08_024411 [Theobroma cacao]|nr:hypothetical protein QQP08_024411 [Theobroma cacao]